MNERIRSREVRVIDSEGEQLGVMTPFDALKVAREKNLDLVEISPTANPPVCRIMDYGKYLYDLGKKEKAAKKSQHVITIKEVKFSINVDEHDFVTKRNRVLRFLQEGDKVKASLRFKGREMTHRNLGRDVLDRLVKDVGVNGTVEFGARMEGNTMHVILAPIKKEPPAKAPKPPKPPKPQQAQPADAVPAPTTSS